MRADHASAASIRARLAHPVIDADGHWLAFGPVVRDAIRRIGGDVAAEGFARSSDRARTALALSVAERRRIRMAQESFWATPSRNTLDRATALFPRLLHERLPELGIDFAVLYPTIGRLLRMPDDAMRRATCRAFNVYTWELFHGLGDRLTPAAVIPMHSPDEAVAELEHATGLGFKVAMLGSLARRVVPNVAELPDGQRVAEWYDPLGLDSAHDYDPVWRRCVGLGIAPTFHTGLRRQGPRKTPTSFTYNHIGHFAAAGEAVCKALVLGGVTRRFPALRVAFLEGGVGWACTLYADLLAHWAKRNRQALEHTNPRHLDHQLLMRLAESHADPAMLAAIRDCQGRIDGERAASPGGIADLDDYAACRVDSAEELCALFVPHFAFGCEADDRANAWAFDARVNPLGARLSAMLGSDIGHFDVPDMTRVLPEAWKLVEDGLLDESDFRDFTFANAVRFWGSANPDFFQGTAVGPPAAAVLAREIEAEPPKPRREIEARPGFPGARRARGAWGAPGAPHLE